MPKKLMDHNPFEVLLHHARVIWSGAIAAVSPAWQAYPTASATFPRLISSCHFASYLLHASGSITVLNQTNISISLIQFI
jgi:hypothetical protein